MILDTSVTNLALPARMDIVPEKLDQLEIAVLKFPFSTAIKNFEESLCRILDKKELESSQRPPYGILNNAILATTSSVVHGFEKYGYESRQMLSVGEPILSANSDIIISHKFNYPSVQSLSELIRCWLDYWGEQEWLQRLIEGVAKKAWRDLLSNLDNPAAQWEKIPVKTLLNNLDAQNGIGYRAISSLLVALLHQKTSVIKGKTVEWRKATSGQAGASGLYLVSRPFFASYTSEDKYRNKYMLDSQPDEDKQRIREGYFSYRLDFLIQTQAGRFNSSGHLKPWLFLRLGCQRYGSEKLKKNNFGRNLSFMLGLNQERLDDFKVDSTLVRLQASRNKDGWQWSAGLTDVLEKFKVNYLKETQAILDNPLTYGNFENKSNWREDEYYLVHTEGYTYGQHHAGHNIKTGYQFKERQEVLGEVISKLGGILKPDSPFETDIPFPVARQLPGAMRNPDTIYNKPHLTTREKKTVHNVDEEKTLLTEKVKTVRRTKQSVLATAINRILGQEQMQILVIYQEPAELQILMEELREVFLLNENENFPSSVEVIEVAIDNLELCQPLAHNDLTKKDSNKAEFKQQLKIARSQKFQAWTEFLQAKISRTDKSLFALIALPKQDSKYDEAQNIKGVVREACAQLGVSSQFLRGVKKSEYKETGKLSYSYATRGKVRNAVRDLTLRQTGILYGPPSEIYELAGLPSAIACQLDVVGFFRLDSNKYGVNFPLAVRLRASGEVDVLYPRTGGKSLEDWQPYHRTGPKLGQLLQKVRVVPPAIKKEKGLILNGRAFAWFICQVLTTRLDKPTLAVISAEKWRNGEDFFKENTCWPQLKNANFLQYKDYLCLPHVNNLNRPYTREDEELSNLVGVIRLRTRNETPQYIANTDSWNDTNYRGRDFKQLSGFIDKNVPGLLHYFSLGRLPDTQDFQNESEFLNIFKWEDEGAAHSFKHQQLLELVPFFLQSHYQSEDMQVALCRSVHYLRLSPSWTTGHTNLPFHMHLGQQLLQDQLCILD